MSGLLSNARVILTLRTIWGALLAGQVIFLVMIVSGAIVQQHRSQPIFDIVAPMYLLLVVPIAFVIRTLLLRGAASAPKLKQLGHLVFWAACESTSFMAMVFAVVGSWAWPLIVCVIVAMLLQVVTFPR
jgi:hypothetical protein